LGRIKVIIYKDFTFETAHKIPLIPDAQKSMGIALKQVSALKIKNLG